MRIHLLGVHSAESRDHRLSCLLIDGRLAIDAGSLTRSLTWDEQRTVEAVALTHWHFDHVRDVATLGQNTRGVTSKPLFALAAVHDLLARSLLGGELWSALYDKPAGAPSWRRCDAVAGSTSALGGLRLTPWLVAHSVPAIGWIIEDGEHRCAVTGDTGAGFAAGLAQLAPVDLLVVECTWDDARAGMAAEQGHLSPAVLLAELARLEAAWGRLPQVRVVHRHPEADAIIADELTAAGPRLRLGSTGEVIEL